MGMAKAKRVLIVDDEERVRRLLRRWVEENGHTVLEAGTAEDALAVLEKNPADVAFCDLQMGGKDGLWLTREIRNRHPRTAVVLATGISTVPPALSMQAGVVAYLVKPFEREHVQQTLALTETWSPDAPGRGDEDVLERWLGAMDSHDSH